MNGTVSGAQPLSMSVVIPALNEADYVQQAVASARLAPGVEVIVADGGSRDDTAALAKRAGARLILGPRGRARQMNAGAAVARGDILVFLHADTLLPSGYTEGIRQALAEERVVGGGFELGIEGPGFGLRAVETMVNLRSRFLGLPYGDQALFVRAPVFRDLGGFPDLRLMEDLDFVRRLKRRGRLAIVPARVVTSPRRWHNLGVVRTTLINQGLIAAYRLGVSPARLARWYSAGNGRRL